MSPMPLLLLHSQCARRTQKGRVAVMKRQIVLLILLLLPAIEPVTTCAAETAKTSAAAGAKIYAAEPTASNNPMLAGLRNPALIGISAIRVVVTYQNAVIGQDDWLQADIAASVERRLIESDPRLAAVIRQGYDARFLDIPILRVNIDKYILSIYGSPIFYVQTALTINVSIERNPTAIFKVDVWSRADTIQAVSLDTERAAVQSLINKQLEDFISDFTQANAVLAPIQDVNKIIPVQPVPAAAKKDSQSKQTDKVKPASEQAKTEYKFVSSKNSIVFHKPDCIWVKQIKPQNLTGYKTREDAIAAGKKPCKVCNP